MTYWYIPVIAALCILASYLAGRLIKALETIKRIHENQARTYSLGFLNGLRSPLRGSFPAASVADSEGGEHD